MIVTTVKIHVKPDRIEDFIRATVENHGASIKEPGNLRFDILQSLEEPARFTLYEVFKSQEDVSAHKKTEHYLKWRETVADWMAEPRRGTPHRVVAPEDISFW